MKRFVVVGLGNFGSSVAEALHQQGAEVVAVDTAEAAVDRIAPLVSAAAVADGRSLAALEEAGARGADAGIVSTGDDITASILATMALRDLGVRETFVKVVSLEHARVMEKIGVTETIFPERESGVRLATRIAAAGLLNYVRLGPDFSVQEMAVPESWIGQTLRQLELPRRYRISIIALHDIIGDRFVPVPPADQPLRESDTLLIAGTDADLARAAQVE